jgi:anti-sigma factor RsiW
MNPQPISEAELHAYADGLLAPARGADVEAWLARHPADEERLQAWRLQNRQLRALFDPVLAEAVPRAMSSPRLAEGAALFRPTGSASACPRADQR